MLAGMLVNPVSVSDPSIRYISEPTISTIDSTATRNTVILARLARSAFISTPASPTYRASLKIRKTRSKRNARITIRACDPPMNRLR